MDIFANYVKNRLVEHKTSGLGQARTRRARCRTVDGVWRRCDAAVALECLRGRREGRGAYVRALIRVYGHGEDHGGGETEVKKMETINAFLQHDETHFLDGETVFLSFHDNSLGMS